MWKDLIEPNRVVVYYKCVQCGAECSILVKEIITSTFLCDKCNKMGNSMEIIGCKIDERVVI